MVRFGGPRRLTDKLDAKIRTESHGVRHGRHPTPLDAPPSAGASLLLALVA